MNQMFGYQIIPEDISSKNNIFEGTLPVLTSTDLDPKSAQNNICTASSSFAKLPFSEIGSVC